MTGMTIVHASDIHFGKPHVPDAAEALLAATEAIAPDLLVLSGDFTQRAKVREYRDARAYLRRFPAIPTVVTPGNHDVPLYRIFERIFLPFRNYREYISKDLDTVTTLPGATVVSLGTADPHRSIVNGRIRPHQLAFARDSFSRAPDGDLRILVAHHHLVSAPDDVKDHPVPGAATLLGHFAGMGVELILGGHLHRGYVATSGEVRTESEEEREILIVHSGTTTSSRGRAAERGKMSFNRIQIESDRIVVTPYLYHPGEEQFVPVEGRAFPRPSRMGVR